MSKTSVLDSHLRVCQLLQNQQLQHNEHKHPGNTIDIWAASWKFETLFIVLSPLKCTSCRFGEIDLMDA